MHLIRRRPAYLRLVRESPAPPPPAVAPVSAGIKGGLAGGFAMAVVAMLCGALSGRGSWYPINLLSSGFFPGAAAVPAAEFGVFHGDSCDLQAAHWRSFIPLRRPRSQIQGDKPNPRHPR
jgi:hypothetical protein